MYGSDGQLYFSMVLMKGLGTLRSRASNVGQDMDIKNVGVVPLFRATGGTC
jgi:hypothetical protein